MENEPQVIIHIMRHATTKSGIRNPPNNPDIVHEGQTQCTRFAKKFRRNASHITHIYSSPMARTMSTAFLAFADVLENGVKVIALPELSHEEDVDVVTWKQKYGERVDDRRLHMRPRSGGKEPDMKDGMKIFRWGDVHQPKVWERREIVLVVRNGMLPPGVKVKLPNAMIKSFTFNGESKLREIKQKEVVVIRKEQMKYEEKLRKTADNERARREEIEHPKAVRRGGSKVTKKDDTRDRKQAMHYGSTPRPSKPDEERNVQGKGRESAHSEMRKVVTQLSKTSLISVDDPSHKRGRKRLREVVIIDDDGEEEEEEEEQEKKRGSDAHSSKRVRPSRRPLR